MAVSLFETTETKFLLTVYDVSSLKSEYLDLKLRGFDWRVFVEKAANDRGEGINIHLERIFSTDDSHYSCIATTLVELKSYDDQVAPYVGRIEPKEFSVSNGKKWSLKPFISWEQLSNPAKQFIQDNEIQIQVTVKVDEKITHGENSTVNFTATDSKSGTELSELKLGLTFDRITKLSAVLSPEILMFGKPIRIQVYKSHQFNGDSEESGSLRVYMWNWRNNNETGASQTVTFQAKFKLLAYEPEGKTWLPSEGSKTYELSTGTREISMNKKWTGFEHFIPWQQLKKDYMSATGSIRMEIDITELKPEPIAIKTESDCAIPSGSTSGSSLNQSVGPIVKCFSCIDYMENSTLLVIRCGHMHCFDCLEALKKAKRCLCGEEFDPDVPAQYLLFD